MITITDEELDKQVLIKGIHKVKKGLEKHGWCQGKGEDEKGRHCLVGALGAYAGLAADRPGAKLWDRLTVKLGGKLGDISTWNDAKGRTIGDVFNLLDELEAELK